MESLNFSVFAIILAAIVFWIIWDLADEFDYEDFAQVWFGRISAFIASFYVGVNFQCLFNGLSWVSPWNFVSGSFYNSPMYVHCSVSVFMVMAFFAMAITLYLIIAEYKGGIGVLFLFATMVFTPLTFIIGGAYYFVAINMRWLTIVIGVSELAVCIGFAICCVKRICENFVYDQEIKRKDMFNR